LDRAPDRDDCLVNAVALLAMVDEFHAELMEVIGNPNPQFQTPY